ncbi:hypothetical protein NKR19_g5089 [Coniochaeta hoffmannii]|uniref:Uncharacterized protein n=1 Tax=Coniochaeta hoffmannii TaxID=91930 RepID=A0AA38VWW6_9PEZI|nr:hypothetical protein NKR19_g5089 [Coniochaeta hoffmannii]
MSKRPDLSSIPQPPLLLTKRVTSFLSANLTPQIHTACLTTPSGNILAHASTVSPARVLRRQAAVAASLWAIHNRPGYGRDVEDALPKTCSTAVPGEEALVPRAITVQLEPTEADGTGTVVVIRGLKCGILFLVLAGPEHGPSPPGGANAAAGAGHTSPPGGHTRVEGGTTSPKGHDGLTTAAPVSRSGTQVSHAHSGSPPDSILSSGTAAGAASINSQGSVSFGGVNTAFALGIRRQAEEIARCLDEKLGPLTIPEESVGGGWDTR